MCRKATVRELALAACPEGPRKGVLSSLRASTASFWLESDARVRTAKESCAQSRLSLSPTARFKDHSHLHNTHTGNYFCSVCFSITPRHILSLPPSFPLPLLSPHSRPWYFTGTSQWETHDTSSVKWHLQNNFHILLKIYFKTLINYQWWNCDRDQEDPSNNNFDWHYTGPINKSQSSSFFANKRMAVFPKLQFN